VKITSTQRNTGRPPFDPQEYWETPICLVFCPSFERAPVRCGFFFPPTKTGESSMSATPSLQNSCLAECVFLGLGDRDQCWTLSPKPRNMSCPHGRGNAPQEVGYDESVSNLMFNEESGWMTARTLTHHGHLWLC
jgi:hypothetical protein